MQSKFALTRSIGTFICTLVLLLSACAKPQESASPREISDDTICALDGMLLRDFPGPKAQIHYADRAPEFFCDTIEMFAVLLTPEHSGQVVAAYTQDMTKADWNNPHDHWIDAQQAFYVQGSDLKGSMGPTFASFVRREDAEAFVRSHGGKVLKFGEVTADMVDLRGGARLDEHM